MPMKKLNGNVVFQDDVSTIKDCNIHVSVEDISKQDASSETKSKADYPNVNLSTLQNSILPFSMEVPVDDDKLHLVVRVHVDVDKDNDVSRGDFVTTSMFSVLTRGNPDKIDVLVKKIN